MSSAQRLFSSAWFAGLSRLSALFDADEPIAGEFRENLNELQNASVTGMALFTGAAGYLWVALMIWPVPGATSTPVAWASALALIISASVALLVKARHLRLAGQLVVWGAVAAIAGAMQLYPIAQTAYLFLIPIAFASLIHRRWTVFLVAIAAGAVTWGMHTLRPGERPLDVLLPIAIGTLTVFTSWLASRNLYVALRWVWSGYERAWRNEKQARERQAELERVLKALDQATYRVERANHMLTLARNQAETAYRLKQQFAQNVSHELRMPLNLILSFVELMIQSPEYYGGPLPASYLRDLSIVHRNAQHLQTLVNDVLDMARIQAAQMSLQPEETQPGKLVEEVAEMARSLIESRGLAWRVEVEPELPALWIDPIRIRQVILNLLNNAARFTEAGSVTLRVRRDGDQLLFSVTDTGVGIAPGDIERVFNEFEQLEGGTGGTGLGLSISRAFVELHGGRMWVESEPDRGSTFSFTLPATRQTLLTAPLHETDAPMVAAQPSDQPILLAVTSSPMAATLLGRYVRGYRTVVVHDLEQAAKSVAQLSPEGVVLDAATVAATPAELQTLAQRWGLPDMPIILTSLPGEARLSQQLNVSGYLIKPITTEGLWDVLRPLGETISRVLVVDDDRDFVRLITRMLESSRLRSYHVTPAYGGHEALAVLERLRPDLILMDLSLGDLSGQAVIAAIRAHPEWHTIPIVAVTAQDDLGAQEALAGTLTVAKARGLTPADVVNWTRAMLDGVAIVEPKTL